MRIELAGLLSCAGCIRLRTYAGGFGSLVYAKITALNVAGSFDVPFSGVIGAGGQACEYIAYDLLFGSIGLDLFVDPLAAGACGEDEYEGAVVGSRLSVVGRYNRIDRTATINAYMKVTVDLPEWGVNSIVMANQIFWNSSFLPIADPIPNGLVCPALFQPFTYSGSAVVSFP